MRGAGWMRVTRGRGDEVADGADGADGAERQRGGRNAEWG